MTERSNNPKPKADKAMKKTVNSMKNANKTQAETSKAPVETKQEIIKDIEGNNQVPEAVAKKEEKIVEKEAGKKPEVKTAKKKKDEAVVNSFSLPISTKKATDTCKFIKGKRIEDVQNYLEEVIRGKKAIPFKGEYAHRKGKMMSGGFPKNIAKHFIVILKGLTGNAAVNGIDDPVIVEAIANLAARPYGRFGRIQRKRTHVKIVARDKKDLLKSKKNKKKAKGKK